MPRKINLDLLLAACGDDSFDDGIRIDVVLEPLSGPGGPVKPATYEGGRYQQDRRWQSSDDTEATPVIVIDNVPSQANRLEEALRLSREATGIPELVLDFSDLSHLPAHLPKRLSSLQFPHRNADAYLRDAELDGVDFLRTDLGTALFAATAQTCGPLVAWFPQALLFGFWQSHLGKKKVNTKHARSWVSEIIGWQPAATDTKVLGLKGDPLNLSTGEVVTSNVNDRNKWEIGKVKSVDGGKTDKLSEIGYGQVPFMGNDSPAASVSFTRVTQRATVSFAQLRRVGLGTDQPDADAAARALLVALGLHAHQLAFGRGFALRSGAELRPKSSSAEWLGGQGDEPCETGGEDGTLALLREAKHHARGVGVPLDGWDRPEGMLLRPKANLRKAIVSTWPELDS